MALKVDNPSEVGADRIVNAVAAHSAYPGPLIVIDFGTATTFDVVDAAGDYCGGVIAPGVNLSLEALHQAAAKLPLIAVGRPERVIGSNTVAAMQSGVFWGYVSMIEGVVQRIEHEAGESMTAVATGGLAPLFAGATDAIDHIDSDLTLRGLLEVTPAQRKRLMTRLPVPAADEILFVPLGGVGDIGMNCALYGHAGRWIMVDLGVMFGDETTPGIEVIVPDTAAAEAVRDRLDAIVVTHAHEDHIGAVPHLWSELGAPVHVTPFSAAFLRRKLRDEGAEGEVPIVEHEPGVRFAVGPFELEYLPLAHSIPEPNALVIRTAAGSIFHTGDWKLDPGPVVGAPVDEGLFRRLGDEGIAAMICDSTNATIDGASGSEADLLESLTSLIASRKQPGRLRLFRQQCGASGYRGAGGWRQWTVHGAGRPVAEAHGRHSPPKRISGGHSRLRIGAACRLPAAFQHGDDLHGEPGRAARRAGAHRIRLPSACCAGERRHRWFSRPARFPAMSGASPDYRTGSCAWASRS